MKKLIFVFMAFVAVSMMSCGNHTDSTTVTTDSDSVSVDSVDTTVVDTIVVDSTVCPD